ncbi:hypothetical protein MN032_02280 [Agromyces atrinae]|uniref:hypothetical protein n=1 Tax=Agromyces atrinae TaxID=592376 RepID=UPI001F5682F3|nr:hypothetical protein [Agromyces atrinae]MCI2956508.1 hypothetical protein [Agromyces atrinae]
MLIASKRTSEAVPLRREFVQRGRRGAPQPGILSEMVFKHDHLGLDLYLLHRMISSAAPWDAGKDAGVWARALGLATSEEQQNAGRVSRIFRRLDEQYGLVRRDGARRGGKVYALQEDGSREPYTSPAGGYSKLPFAYWRDGWHRELSLSAKAVMLIGLSLKPGFIMPQPQVKTWYGISADTWGKGVLELRKAHLLDTRTGKDRDWLRGKGYRFDIEYSMLAPFNTRAEPVKKKEEPEVAVSEEA